MRCLRTVLYFTTAIKHSRVNVVYSNIYSIAKDSVCTGMLISPLPDQEGNKVMFLSECREYPSAPCLAGGKNLIARVSMLLKSLATMTCFRACFLPDLAKDLSAPRYLFFFFLGPASLCTKCTAALGLLWSLPRYLTVNTTFSLQHSCCWLWESHDMGAGRMGWI